MGNKQSTSSTNDVPVATEKEQRNSDCDEASTVKDPTMELQSQNEQLQAQNVELQDQLQNIRALAEQSKEKERQCQKKWEDQVEENRLESNKARQEATKLLEEHHASLAELGKLRDRHACSESDLAKLREVCNATLVQLSGSKSGLAELSEVHDTTLAQLSASQARLSQAQQDRDTSLAEISRTQGELSKLREEAADQAEELTKAQREVAKLGAQQASAIETNSKDLAAAKAEIRQMAEAASASGAKAAQLEVERNAAQEDADAANARSKAATEREAKAVHQRMIADTAQKTAEKEMLVFGKQLSEKSQALKEQIESQVKMEDLLVPTPQATVLQQELTAVKGELERKAEALLASEAAEAEAVHQRRIAETAQKTAEKEMLAFEKQLSDKSQALKEQIESQVKMEDLLVPTPQANVLQQELASVQGDLKRKAEALLASEAAEAEARTQLTELRAKRQAEDSDPAPPEKKVKVKLEPGVDTETCGAVMTAEMQQLVLSEYELLQQEKKERDKVLKDFKRLAKMDLDKYVEQLSVEADANKAAAKAKGKKTR